MDLLEYKQTAEVLKLIEEDLPEKKYSDREFDDMLEEYIIHNKNIKNETNRWGIPYTYGNGMSQKQIDMVRGILLSAEYNYDKFEQQKLSEKKQLEEDLEKGTYKGKTLDDYEKLRLETAEKIGNTENFTEKVQLLTDNGEIINEGIEKLAEYKLLKDIALSEQFLTSAVNMIDAGFSLEKISYYLDEDIYSIYCLAECLGRPFNLSEQEDEVIKKIQSRAEEEKQAFQTSCGIVPENKFAVPKAPMSWNETVEILKKTVEEKKGKIEIYSSKPLASDMFLNNPEVIIDIKYKISAVYCAHTLLNIFKNAFLPAEYNTVTNNGHMLLFANKTKTDEGIICDDKHCVYKAGKWNIAEEQKKTENMLGSRVHMPRR